MDTRGCGRLTSNETYLDDSWFSGVKMAKGAMDEGVDYCGPAKTIHKCFCLDKLEKFTKDWPGGSYLVLNINPRDPGDRPLMEIGYKYDHRKVLGFIAIEGDVSIEPGDSCLSCFHGIFIMFMFSPFFSLTC